jgi:hypothetical protein
MITRAMLICVVIQDYKETCKNIEYNSSFGGTLSANCGDGNGGYPYTQITDIDACGGNVRNTGGSLQCIQQG